MEWIDSHVHLFHDDFRPDLDDVLVRGGEAGIAAYVVPATDVASSRAVMAMAGERAEVRPAVGIHPHEAAKTAPGDLDVVATLAGQGAVAVGEVGLDYYYDFAPRQVQQEVFREQLALAVSLDLPVIVHTRESMSDALTMVQEVVAAHPEWRAAGGRGVFHCFTGSADEAKRLFRLGFYVSFPGILTFKRSPVAATFAEIGLERVLIETDAPYMAPVPHRGKRNEPSFLLKTAEAMSNLSGASLEQVASVTTANARSLFSLD